MLFTNYHHIVQNRWQYCLRKLAIKPLFPLNIYERWELP